MDGAPPGWYFSQVERPGAERVERVEFLRHKYGRELLVDAGYVSTYAHFEREGRPHALAFYDILLVTRGRGRFHLDGAGHRVAPGALFLTRPGQVRRWRAAGVDGACIFFTREFVAEAFSDPHFLDRFACFAALRPTAALHLGPAEQRQYRRRFAAMQREIRRLPEDASHALRAVLYDVLVLLDRLYVARHGRPRAGPPSALAERFEEALEKGFRSQQRVAGYARELGVSAAHLSAVCRARHGRGAGALVRARVVMEARRLLAYTGLTAAEVADQLGFADPSYFARYFRRETGLAPTTFRARAGAPALR
jgi:AraC family transcriptional regulator, transcriptional activator of pobA